MAPPKYSDLLSNSNDVLLRGMHYGWWRFLCSTKGGHNIQFITTGESNLNRDVIACFKYRKFLPEWNMVFSQRFWSNKDVSAQLSLINKPWQGLYMAIGETYNFDNENFRTHLKLAYANDFLNFNAFTAIEDKKPPVNAAIVFGKDQFLAGLQAIVDTEEPKLAATNYCLGFNDGKFAVHGFYNMGSLEEGKEDMRQVALSLWTRYSEVLDMAGLVRHRTDSDSESKIEFGVKYKLDDSCFLRFKVDSDYQLGIGMSQALYGGMNLYLATRVNVKGFSEGGHKLGIALELVA